MVDPSQVIALFLALVVALVILRSFLPSRRRGGDTAPTTPKADDGRQRVRQRVRQRLPPKASRQAAPLPDLSVNPRSILVDGSNVMHWDANTPNAATLMRVLAALRKHGNDPILCFDANVGYKLFGAHLNPEDLSRLFGVTPAQVLIAPSGTDADAMILNAAATHAIPVVSNDQYRDYPDLAGRVERMTGTISEGVVTLRLRKPAQTNKLEARPNAV